MTCIESMGKSADLMAEFLYQGEFKGDSNIRGNGRGVKVFPSVGECYRFCEYPCVYFDYEESNGLCQTYDQFAQVTKGDGNRQKKCYTTYVDFDSRDEET